MHRSSLEMRNRVSYVAQRHYDVRRGRCDWETVSHALQEPLLACLRSFDARHSQIHPRRISGDTEWALDDIAALKQFTESHFRTQMTSDDWVLAGRYMNIAHSDCIAKMWTLNTFQMTPQLYSQIAEFRQAGLLWPTICSKATSCSPDILRFAYSTTSKDKVQKLRRPKAQFRISKHQHWTEDEDKHLTDLLSQFDNGRDIDWNYISKTIGHSKNACRYRRILLMRSQKSREASQSSSPDMSTKSDSPLAYTAPKRLRA
ncbi:hypothetical protein GGH12_001083 [Coemansia sp. RSA 1822]|nr:hypothetical protein LPJ76_000508 [Coemansia sp. RSA 638]KAJ2545085.1 hypothetical protein GGF49_000694 [Coemansia sp. RSA 1853]KAJ2565999.1 hypothetical protein GGH12_001083 [Coemansia sp. RSA 1822]